jgi:hypothetical protein
MELLDLSSLDKFDQISGFSLKSGSYSNPQILGTHFSTEVLK